jgi:small subunit ribosomal protein S6
MSRIYEVMFIVRPDLAEEDVDKLIAGYEATVTNGGGAIKSVEKMGKRKLAYTVRKFNDGNYILLTVQAEGGLIAELERRLRVSEQVIKFITVRTDEEDKRIAKIKAIRGTRVKRSAEVSPVQSAPAQPAAQPAPAQPVAAQPAPVESEPAAEAAPAPEAAEPVQASV